MNKPQAMRCLSILTASYPKQSIQAENLEAYALMLQDLEEKEVMRAVQRLICTSKWFPTIAEIRSEVAEGALAQLPEVELAWGEVNRAIGRWGMNRKPRFSCPEIEQAVEAIGWRHICLDENVTSTRARFLDAYRRIRTGAVTRKQLGGHSAAQDQLPEPRRLPGEENELPASSRRAPSADGQSPFLRVLKAAEGGE